MATKEHTALRRRVLDILSDRAPTASSATGDQNPVAALALTWLERWTEHGGSVIKTPDHRFIIGAGVHADQAPKARKLAHPTEDTFQEAWDDGRHTGSMREAEDFLRASPLLTIYVKAAVELAPALGVASAGGDS